jgi:hypothetical protein
MAHSTQRNITTNEQEEFLPLLLIALRCGLPHGNLQSPIYWVRRSGGCHGGAGHRLRHRTHSHHCSQATVVERRSTQ